LMDCLPSRYKYCSVNFTIAFQNNDPTPDLEARAMPHITYGGVTHRLNRLAAGNLTPRIAAALPTGGIMRGRGHGRVSPRTRRKAQNTRTSDLESTNTPSQSHYAANQFNYLRHVGLRKGKMGELASPEAFMAAVHASHGKDDNAGSGDCNDMNERGFHFSPSRLNALLDMIENFTLALNARTQQSPGILPARHHYTEAPPVEASSSLRQY
jgi:hypothetical protein